MTNLESWMSNDVLSLPLSKELINVEQDEAFYAVKYDGVKVQLFIHHWGEELVGNEEYLESFWEAADVVICCHPEHLPVWVRDKHPWPDHVGEVAIDLAANNSYYEVRAI